MTRIHTKSRLVAGLSACAFIMALTISSEASAAAGRRRGGRVGRRRGRRLRIGWRNGRRNRLDRHGRVRHGLDRRHECGRRQRQGGAAGDTLNGPNNAPSPANTPMGDGSNGMRSGSISPSNGANTTNQ